ncbi:MAG TPA: DJ-1/PfpI family protein [Thermoanaerobaculia bacterium]|nr:DJ-1/PfpI family protein [Thermoanaerobaculia bacterium]
MKRREFLQRATAFGFLAAMPSAVSRLVAGSRPAGAPAGAEGHEPGARPRPLTPPAQGSVPVAFLVSPGAVVIDFCGPWEVFQDVMIPGRMDHPFDLYIVAESTEPIRLSGGLTIVPEYTLESAPAPKVLVIPAQRGRSEAMLAWIRKAAKGADVTMSVCTGAFLLARTGLLANRAATTHHDSYKQFAMEYPAVRLKRGARFVEDGNLASAGGLTSGIDLALRVVERYYGSDVAKKTAYYMEYQGQGWLNPAANEVYASVAVSTDAHPLCLACSMEVDKATAPKSAYKGKAYYFCSQEHKELFDKAPARYI